MHIPDGYLSPETCGALYLTSAPFWYVAVQRVRRLLSTRFLPMISVFAAFSFVIMMFNLPLPGGTTGHAVGMGIAAIVLGPWAAILAISTALVIQALFFGDGGITALGANCFNMAIVGSLVAYGCYRALSAGASLTSRRRVFAGAVAGYAAINVAALCAAVEFGLQPLLFHDKQGTPLYCPYPLSISIPAMAIGHLSFAGLAELAITAGLVAYLQRAEPALLMPASPRAPLGAARQWRFASRKLWMAVCVLLVLTPLGILAVGSAWGEWTAEDFRSSGARQQMAKASSGTLPPVKTPAGLSRWSALWNAPFARYSPAVVPNASAGYLLSAAIGVGLIACVLFLLRPLLLRRNARTGFVEQSLRSLLAATQQAVFAEDVARSSGLAQRADPRIKLVGLTALIVASISVHHLSVLTALLGLAVLFALVSLVPVKLLASTVWIPALILSGTIALPSLFITGGAPVWHVPVAGWAVTEQGVRTASLLLLRVLTAATFSAVMILTTEWARVLRALRFFRVPVTAVVLLGMTHRYLFLLLKTAREMLESRASRQVGTLSGRDGRRMAAATVAVLLSKTFELSAEVHGAMRSRGFDGEVQLLDDPRIRAADALQIALLFLIAAGAIVVGR